MGHAFTLTRFWISREGKATLIERVHEAHVRGSKAVKAVLDRAALGASRDMRNSLSWPQLQTEIAYDCEDSDAHCDEMLARFKFESDAECLRRWPEDAAAVA